MSLIATKLRLPINLRRTCSNNLSFHFLRVLCVLCGLLGFAFPQTSLNTAATPPIDRNAFTFTNYDLQVRIEPAHQSFGVRGKVTLRNDSSKSQSFIALQISSSLKWASIQFHGEPLRFESKRIASDIDHTGAVNEAVAELPPPLAPKQTIELEIAYQGMILLDASRLENLGMPGELAKRNDWDRFTPEFTAVRGVGYVTWYPVAIEPARMGDGNKVFDLLGRWKARHSESSMHVSVITVAEDGVVCEFLSNATNSPGVISESDRAVMVTTAIEFKRIGIATPVFVIAPFKSIDSTHGKLFYLATSEDAARQYAAVLEKMEPVISNGRTTPVQIIQLPDKFTAFESGSTLLTPLVDATEKDIQNLLIHTLTHGAFYSSRPWIYEGLAHYAQLRLREQQDGRKAALAILNSRRASLAIAEAGTNEKQNLATATDEVFYRTKAMFVWWMLRELVGQSVFEMVLAKYISEEDKVPSYVQRLFEVESKKRLEWFFDDWVYRDRGLPDFRITAVFVRKEIDGGFLVTVTVENQGGAGAEVLLRIPQRESEVNAKLLVPANGKATARLHVNLPPKRVIVNDGSVPETDTSDNEYVVESVK